MCLFPPALPVSVYKYISVSLSLFRLAFIFFFPFWNWKIICLVCLQLSQKKKKNLTILCDMSSFCADARQTPAHQPRTLRDARHRQEGQPRPTIKPCVSTPTSPHTPHAALPARLGSYPTLCTRAARWRSLRRSAAISGRLPATRFSAETKDLLSSLSSDPAPPPPRIPASPRPPRAWKR